MKGRRITGATLWLLCAVLFGVPALAQKAPPTIDIATLSDLAFGSLIASPGGGTVTIAPDGTRTDSGVFAAGASGFGPATFRVTVTGQGNQHYAIMLPAGITLTNGTGGTMTVDTFQSDPSGTGLAKPPANTENIAVGATLRVGSAQPSGAYQGTFVITVNLL